ncbi:hypothetical protein [Rhizobium sp. 2MFCol3.1]|nr:hypothetical protein [Rhizobium sp. 2MFCol3.1]
MSNYDICVPLIGEGYSQDAVLNLLLPLNGRGVIELLDDNRTKVLKLGR